MPNHRMSLPMLGLALALISGAAQAGRPMATDDAGVLEQNECELESFGGRFGARGEPASRTASAQLGCGLGFGHQLALAVARSGPTDSPVRAVALGGKFRLNDAGEKDTAWSVGWGLTAERGDGHGFRHETSFVTAIMSRPLTDETNLHANLGWSRAQSTDQSTLGWSIGLERSLTETLDVTVETFGSDRDHSPWVQAGLRWTLQPDRFSVDTSYGRQSGSSQASAFTLGLKLSF